MSYAFGSIHSTWHWSPHLRSKSKSKYARYMSFQLYRRCQSFQLYRFQLLHGHGWRFCHVHHWCAHKGCDWIFSNQHHLQYQIHLLLNLMIHHWKVLPWPLHLTCTAVVPLCKWSFLYFRGAFILLCPEDHCSFSSMATQLLCDPQHCTRWQSSFTKSQLYCCSHMLMDSMSCGLAQAT